MHYMGFMHCSTMFLKYQLYKTRCTIFPADAENGVFVLSLLLPSSWNWVDGVDGVAMVHDLKMVLGEDCEYMEAVAFSV